MVELSRLTASLRLSGRLLCKLEYLNPGGSKKDRVARAMIEAARREGMLRDGQPVVELTSGNTGTGLAIICGALGHPFIAVMSMGNTMERARQMRALGAEVVLVDQATGSPKGTVSGADLALVEQRAVELARERGAFRADQFRMRANVEAHEQGTGPEMWRQSEQTVDVFVDFAGTGGTFTGVSRYLRRVNASARCYVVEPAGAAVLAGEQSTRPSHVIQGGGYSFADLPLLDRSLVTDYLTVTDEQAIDAARRVAREHG